MTPLYLKNSMLWPVGTLPRRSKCFNSTGSSSLYKMQALFSSLMARQLLKLFDKKVDVVFSILLLYVPSSAPRRTFSSKLEKKFSWSKRLRHEASEKGTTGIVAAFCCTYLLHWSLPTFTIITIATTVNVAHLDKAFDLLLWCNWVLLRMWN